MEENKHDGRHEHRHKKSKEPEAMTISKLTLWKTISGILGVLLIVSLFTGSFDTGSKTSGTSVQEAEQAQPAQAAQPRQAAPSAAPTTDFASLADDDAVKGDADAPVTIVEWSDFECPYCVRFYEQTLGQIDEKYIKTGKVKLIYRDFPLGNHRQAQKAAEAAECADEQGKYYEMHDALFEKGVAGGVSSFKQYAADIGLDTAEFNDCLDTGKMASEVAKDMIDGQSAGISGTPGFVINGQLVSGAQPFSVFEQIIEAELAK